MVASTTAFLGASRFGLAPSATKTATAGLKVCVWGGVLLRSFASSLIRVERELIAFFCATSNPKKTLLFFQLVDQNPGLKSNDPAGFTAADVLGAGALGHGIGVGVILGLRALGKL